VSLSFYDSQKQILAKEIAELIREIKAYQTREGIVDLEEERTSVVRILNKIKDRIQGANLDIDQGKGKIAEIERRLKEQPERVIRSQDVTNVETRIVHDKLVRLTLEKTELLQKYTEKDRRVRDKVKEIEEVRKRLAASAGKKVVVGERTDLNSIRQTLQKELERQKVKLGQVDAKRKKLMDQMDKFTKELRVLNSKGYKLEQLNDTLEKKKDLYLLYTKKAEEARITAAMDRENLVNVKLLDYAGGRNGGSPCPGISPSHLPFCP
ncbi:MAG: hypothetical protein ACE5JO_07860, partial [Candidatus Binatia bacterium]